jgi:DNA repair exonuclease SbcCD nuclease subunit
MNNYLFFSDLHLTQNSITECKDILEEIDSLCTHYNITQVFDLGDTFDKISPSSEELDIFASFVSHLNRPIVILAANSHESTTYTNSVLNHFQLLKETITVVKEYIDFPLYCGHFIIKDSQKNYGGTVDRKTVQQYPFVLLGHGHNPEKIGANIIQLGSCRFVDFGEDKTAKKQIAVCLNYKEEKQKWLFIPLKSAISMYDIVIDAFRSKAQPASSENAFFDNISALSDYLNQLSSKSKVRLIFKNYSLWTEFLSVAKTYKEKFVLFAEKKDFVLSDIALGSAKNETVSLKENLLTWINKNKIDNKIKDILLEEIK